MKISTEENPTYTVRIQNRKKSRGYRMKERGKSIPLFNLVMACIDFSDT